VAALLSVASVQLLDRHSDADHNRSVITILGDPAAVEEAMFRGISKAAEHIDMDTHEGAHPRIGAADVVPFVPIRDMAMADCVLLAKRLGERVAEQLGIPVYLYEEAAASPERANLEFHRRGQYEGLKKDIVSDSDRKPDYGPSRLGKAGAIVIGAREPLVAFNVYLNTDDLSIAKQIAKHVRHSSGGFRFVKGMGVIVEGKAQVSMNLTNFRKSSIPAVVEFIRREAHRFGTSIHHCELVGLIPQEALVDTAVWYTQLDGFKMGQILENQLLRLQTPPEENRFNFLDELASAAPTPGGGSAAAFTAAESAALIAMVAGLTIGKKKYAEVEDRMRVIQEEAEHLRQELAQTVDDDADAFAQLMAAFRMPKETDAEKKKRDESILMATYQAAEIPLRTVRAARDLLLLAKEVAESGNLNAISDAGTAAALAFAAAVSAGANVRINLLTLKEDEQAARLLKDLVDYERRVQKMHQAVHEILKERGGIELLR
jgi:glutamate formiminotransferase/formiminotetrahydrofolate cyclodeaminase